MNSVRKPQVTNKFQTVASIPATMSGTPSSHGSFWLQSHSEENQIELQRILNHCFWWPGKFNYFSIFRDLVHLVGVQKTSSPQRYVIDGRIRRSQTPFHLVVLFWFSPDNISLGRTWAFNTFFSVSNIRIVRLPSFFSLVEQGIQAVVRAVSKARQDFVGERIQIIPSCQAHSRWEAWKVMPAVPIRRIGGLHLKAIHAGYVLETLDRQHSFTWDTITSSSNTVWCKDGVINMRIMMTCRSEDCPLYILSFYELTEMRTLTSSDLLPSGPYQLSILAMPLHIVVVCMLITAALLKGLKISLKKAESEAAGPLQGIHFSFWNLLPLASPQSNRRLWLQILWVVPVSLAGILYTTVLQSAIVVPQLHYSELSLEDVMHQNFTFLSTVSEHVKQGGELENKQNFLGERICPGQDAACLHKETLLGRKVEPVVLDLEVGSTAFVLSQLSLKNRRVLVEENLNRRIHASIIRALGRNAVERREKFLANAFHWMFRVEKSWMLQQTLERMHAFGFVRHFRQKFETQYSVDLAEAAKLEALSKDIIATDDGIGIPVGFSDSIVAEAFLLLLYSGAICVFVVAGRFMAHLCFRVWIWATDGVRRFRPQPKSTKHRPLGGPTRSSNSKP